MQDAVGDYWQTALEAWRHTLAVAKNVEAAQSSQQRPIELRLRLDASSARLDAARARVFDPELRSLAVKFQRHAVAVWATKNPDLMEGPHKDASFAQFKMQERVNVLLKELF